MCHNTYILQNYSRYMAAISDRFGVWAKYPTKDSNEFYTPLDLTKDRQEIGEYSQDINRIRHIGGKVISSNDTHFHKEILNVEATGYFKVIKNMDDISVKLRGGHHSDDVKILHDVMSLELALMVKERTLLSSILTQMGKGILGILLTLKIWSLSKISG